MLINPPLERLLPKAENRYVLTMLTAKRARQLTQGANPMVESETPNFVSLAAEEIDQNKVLYRKGRHDPFIPLRPEIEAARLQAERDAEEKRAQELLEETRRMVDVDEQTLVRAINSFDSETFTAMDADELARQFIQFVDATDMEEAIEQSGAEED
ncbi:MAG TPA: DNA-directed RNA polymerase subunit omega [Clostridiaceae bacterium]|jgi:DNA-directed RNA polymerase subunit omega|nr:DNA-directed RNA polymerase subunit omega [Clostridiaceae bacterium]